jgi:CDGSH-type Zn-finger protein
MDKAKVAGKVPQMEQLEEGKKYAWCSCGISENQPWCNGAHKGSDFSPKTAAMCMCKQTKNPPYCDGAHASL